MQNFNSSQSVTKKDNLLKEAVDFRVSHEIREFKIDDNVLATFFGFGQSLDFLTSFLRPFLHSLSPQFFP